MPFPPLLALLLIDLLVPDPQRQRSPGRTGVLLGLAIAAQALIGEEVLASSALAATVGVVALGAWHRGLVRARIGPAVRGLAVAGVTAGALLAWPLSVQFFGAGRVRGSIQPSGIAVSDLWTFVTPTPMQEFGPDAAVRHSLRFTGNAVEVGGYLGVPLVLLAIGAAVVARRHPLVRVLVPVGIVMAVLSLGDHLHVGCAAAPGGRDHTGRALSASAAGGGDAVAGAGRLPVRHARLLLHCRGRLGPRGVPRAE